MLVTYGITIPLFLAVLWAFFRYSPKVSTPEKLRLFNIATMLLALSVSATYVIYLRHKMEGGSDYGWWPVLSLLSFLVISSIVIGLLGVVRNFIVFREHGT